MTSDLSSEAEVLHEAWLRACRVDELLSRFDPPPPSVHLVEVILQRARSGSQPPDAVLMGAAAGLSAHQWTAKSGEVVQRQIGRLILTVANAVEVGPRVLAEIHMLVSAAAAQVSLAAWRVQAETDELTRLRNSYGLHTDLEEATKRGVPLRVGFIDLDGLKQVNTEQGHEAGNRLIQEFGERLREVVHEQGGTAYRPHGDEFIAVLATEEGHLDDALSALQESQEFAFSWGVAEWPTDDEDMQTVQRLADQAMYEMKDAHKAAAAAAAAIESEAGGGDAVAAT